MSLFEVPKTKKYPLGVRYSLICIDPATHKRVLMDNHHPKGPHVHFDDREVNYEFVSKDALFADFKKFVSDHMGVQL